MKNRLVYLDNDIVFGFTNMRSSIRDELRIRLLEDLYNDLEQELLFDLTDAELY